MIAAQTSASRFASITVKDYIEDSTITSEMLPHRHLKGIGRLWVKNDIIRSHIKSEGHVNAIIAGAMADSTVFVGTVTEADELPSGTTDGVYTAEEAEAFVAANGLPVREGRL